MQVGFHGNLLGWFLGRGPTKKAVGNGAAAAAKPIENLPKAAGDNGATRGGRPLTRAEENRLLDEHAERVLGGQDKNPVNH